MENKEINYFFNSLEDALQTGINKITMEFVKKQAVHMLNIFKK